MLHRKDADQEKIMALALGHAESVRTGVSNSTTKKLGTKK